MHSYGLRGILFGLASIVALCGAVLFAVEHPNSKSLDFIERYLGFSPDNGDGSMEILILVALAMVVAGIALSMRSPVR